MPSSSSSSSSPSSPSSSEVQTYINHVTFSSPSASHDRTKARHALKQFTSAGPMAANGLDSQQRRRFTIALLNDLKTLGPVSVNRYDRDDNDNDQDANDADASLDEDRFEILKALKELSRLPGGSVVQSEPTSLGILLKQVSTPPTVLFRRASSSSSTASSSTTSTSGGHARVGSAFSRAWTKHSSRYRRGANGSTSSTGYPNGLLPPPAYPSVAAAANASSSPASIDDPPSPPTPLQWEITDVALRCINNALYLHETSRKTFAEERIGGGTKAIQLLSNPWQTPAEILFLACRLLFFATLFEASFNERAVDDQGLIENLQETLDALGVGYANCISPSQHASRPLHIGPTGTEDQVKAATAEALKVIFNLGIYYSNRNSSLDKLGPLLDPVLRLVLLLPPTKLVSPASNAVGVLLNFPIKPYRAKWLSACGSSSPRSISSSSSLSSPGSTLDPRKKGRAKRVAKALFPRRNSSQSQSTVLPTNDSTYSYSLSRPSSPTPSIAASVKSTKSTATGPVFDPAQVQAPGVPSCTMTPSSSLGSNASTIRRDWETLSLADALPDDVGTTTMTAGPASATTVIAHVTSFLTHFLDTYFPPYSDDSESFDADDCSVRDRAQADGIDLESSAQPLCLLLRNLAAEDDELRVAIKGDLLPDNLDRTIAPDRRRDATGKLIRLMSSVTCARLAQVTGELLFALCKCDAKTMVNEIGYGPCAGFLVSKGLVGAFPESERTAGVAGAGGRSINPISGQYEPTEAETAHDPINNMTQEEKEAEAERLFGLFDRLNRTGVVKVQHPVRDASEDVQARFEDVTRQEDEEEKKRETQEEEEAVREFARYKAARDEQRQRAKESGRASERDRGD